MTIWHYITLFYQHEKHLKEVGTCLSIRLLRALYNKVLASYGKTFSQVPDMSGTSLSCGDTNFFNRSSGLSPYQKIQSSFRLVSKFLSSALRLLLEVVGISYEEQFESRARLGTLRQTERSSDSRQRANDWRTGSSDTSRFAGCTFSRKTIHLMPQTSVWKRTNYVINNHCFSFINKLQKCIGTFLTIQSTNPEKP